MSLVQLQHYDNSWYKPGGSFLKRAVWMMVGQHVFASTWLPGSSLRVSLLRAFGARVGQGVVIKPSVTVKYPWHLEIGDHTWVGERVWIDNLTTVRIGSNACVSQGAYLCTGNHDWSEPGFGLMIAPIQICEGAWAGAKSVLTPGAVLGNYAIAAAGSVIVGSVPDFHIYAGNPAKYVKTRKIRQTQTPARTEVHL
jgi:putative colanic acid biosynthesis acetyltransferase WcaF